MRRFVVAFLLTLGIFGALAGAQTESTLRPGETRTFSRNPLVPDEPMPDRPGSSAKALKVVDDATGKSIAGARVYVIEENDHPEPSTWPALVESSTNAVGFAWLDIAPLLPRPVAIVVEAVGYAPATAGMYPGTEVVRLEKSVDLPVRVVDDDGAPIANAKIGYHINCGHMPNLREAVTDANGLAIVRSINPHEGDLWVAASGFRIDDYFSASAWDGTDQPLVLTLHRGSDAVGRIVDSGGRPVAGALVGSSMFHRGPWTRTDADGNFRLIGTPENTEIEIVRTIDGKKAVWTASRAPEGVSRTITLPETPGDCESGTRVRATVTVVDKDGKTPCESINVRFLRETDGATAHGVTDISGSADVDLLPGEYRLDLFAADRSIAPMKSRPTIVAESAPAFRFTVARSPELSLPLARPSGGSHVFYAVGEFEQMIEFGDGPVSLLEPIGAEGTVRIETRGKEPRYFRAPFKLDPMGPAMSEWRPSVVYARFVDEKGAPIIAESVVVGRGELSEGAAGPKAARGSSARHIVSFGGRGFLAISPLDQDLLPTFIPIPLPRRDGMTIDLVDVVVRSRANCRVVVKASAGNDAPDPLGVEVFRGDLRFDGSADEDGAIDLPWSIEDGDRVAITTSPTAMIHRTTIRRGPGAEAIEIRLPSGSLEVQLKDANGEPIASSGALCVDDQEFEIVEGRACVTGLAAGRHEVAVGVRGRGSLFFELTIDDGETRRLDAVLRP